MLKPGPLEIGLILVIILIVFGVGKLPQVGAALGQSIAAFKKGQKVEDEPKEEEVKVAAKKKTAKKKTTAKKATASETESDAESSGE